MDPEEQRRIASMGGRASHGGRARDYESDWDEDRGYQSRGRDYEEDYDYDEDEGYGGWEEDEEEDFGSSRRSAREGSSRRGFASMNPREQRRIASMGGRASHGGGRRGRSSKSSSYSSR